MNPPFKTNRLQRNIPYLIAANAAVTLVDNVVHFTHWVKDHLGRHTSQKGSVLLSLDEAVHVKCGGKLVIKDSGGNEHHFN